MTSQLSSFVKNGFLVLKSSNRLIFVGLLLFIFPLLFLYITNTFVETAERNIETTEKRRVAMLHDAIVILLKSYETNPEFLREFLSVQQKEMSDVTEVRIAKKTSDGYYILESYEEEKESSYESVTDMYTMSQPESKNSLIFPIMSGNERTWQAIRAVTLGNETWYVVSEHSFANIDSVMKARQQQAYLGLTAIFAFLISLAYWFGRQIDWHKRYDVLSTRMKERDLFTNMIAHEFRTPLTAIRGYTGFLADSSSISTKEKTFVEAVQTSTERLLSLVNDFLEVARIQSGKMGLELKTVDIQPTIMAVVEALQPLANEKGLILSFHRLAVPVVMTTDTKRLYQILQNLVSNSLKYTQKGTVEVTIDAIPKAVSIRIKDTGMGISAEDQRKLFEPFGRLEEVDKSAITGTGLGMWITKQLAEALNGTVAVESIKEVGTHVVVVFRR